MNEVELKLTANIDEATKDVARFSKEYQQMARAVERPLRQVNSFRDLQETLQGTQRELKTMRDRVRELGGELARTANPSKQLQNEYRAAASELGKLERTEGVLTNQIARRRVELKAAGVDTRNLAAEQNRLAAALKSALSAGRADTSLRDARSALGVGEIENAQRELVELRRQYQLVTKDGNLSATQRAEAESNYRKAVSLSLSQLRVLREATRSTGITAEQAAQKIIQEQRRVRSEYQQTTLAARKSALESARNDLGVTRYRALKTELKTTRTQYELLKNAGMLTTRELAIAQQAMTQRVRETQRALRDLAAEQDGQGESGGLDLSSLGIAGPIGGAYALYRSIKGVSDITDAYSQMNARLALVTESQAEFNEVQQRLEQIAVASESPLESLITLYTRISRPLKEAGKDQREILAITEAVALSFRVSGASATEAEAGVIQFSQALGAGALRGDEFNSVAEQAPRLMQALADGIGVPVSALRDMAKEGKLTADVISRALMPQLEVLRAESESLPGTVGGALIRLTDAWNKAIGTADTTPLISAIDDLNATISDPSVMQGILTVAGGVVTLATAGAYAVSEFGEFGTRLGYIAAAASGATTELDGIEQRLKDIDRGLSGTGLNRTLDSFIYTKEELQKEKELLQERRETLIAELTGMNQAASKLGDEANQTAEQAQAKALEARQKYVEALKQSQAEELKASKDSLKKLLAEEKKANSELETIRKERLDIQNRYKEALEGLGGGDGPSYGAAQTLKVGARNALQQGDVEGAQRQAREALKILQELDQAGENTYGFEGFIKELEGIDLAANKLQENKAVDELERINAAIVAVKEQAEALKDLDVSVKLDDASLQAAKNQLAEFARSVNGTELVIPIRTVYSDGTVDVTDISDRFRGGESLGGFAGGGWTGRGSKYQVAGVVHADEYVQPKHRMQEPGALAFMEAFRNRGMSLLRNGYADGGLVTPPRNLPAIPQLAPSVSSQGNGLQPLNLTMPNGQTYELSGQPSVLEQLGKAVGTMKLKGRNR
jgi:tape measure domain-containing protein